MIAILLNDNSFEQDIRELLMAFYPGETFTHREDEAKDAAFLVRGEREGDTFSLSLEPGKGTEGDVHFSLIKPDFSSRIAAKNAIKQSLYRLLFAQTGKKLPWGTLTGIRPTKIALTRLEEGQDAGQIRDYMKETYFASEEKIRLSLSVAEREKRLLEGISAFMWGSRSAPPRASTVPLLPFPLENGRGRCGFIWMRCFGNWRTWRNG